MGEGLAWEEFGEMLGWELVTSCPEGTSAEFKVPSTQQEQGYEFICITLAVRNDIEAAIERASRDA